MSQVLELEEKYSTTRRVIKADPQEVTGLVRASKKPEDKFETVLFWPEGEGRLGEGGLRTKGYFKVGGIIKDYNSIVGLESTQLQTGIVSESTPASPAVSYTMISDISSEDRISKHDPHSCEGENIELFLTPTSSSLAKPLITVVTVVFNGEEFLEETILSVINQTYDNVEYIIIDGGSTDGTLDIIKKYEHAIDYWVSEKDRGIYDAMNKGVELATGEWINFMNADDFFASKYIIQKVKDNLRNISPLCSIIYGALNLVKDSGEILNIIETPSDVARNKLSYQMSVPHQSQFSKLSVIKLIGGFKIGYEISGDYEMTLRLLRDHDFYFINNLIVASMRVGGISSNPASSMKVLNEDRRAQLENGLPMSIPFVLACIRVYIRLSLWKLFGEHFTRKLLDFGNGILGRKTYWTKVQK